MTELLHNDNYAEYLASVLSSNNLSRFATDPVCSKLACFCEYLLEQNKLFNLTAIKTPESAALLHFADSLTLAEFIPENSKILDIGSGAGFPAIPLAIARPDVHVTALDSTLKRVNFINTVAKRLGLPNIIADCHRAEDITGKEFKEAFDIVTARAVASYPILLELALPAVKIGGKFVAMKSKDVSRETEGIEKVLRALSITKPTFHNSVISNSEESFERCIVEITKLASTPAKYPRVYTQIKKKPIF